MKRTKNLILFTAYIFSSMLIVCCTSVSAANIYVDTLPAESGSNWDGIDGHAYSGTPGVGTGYSTIQGGVNAMSAGDALYMRGGTYRLGGSEVSLRGKNGTSWNEGGYFKMCSYPGEWAILDGERNTTNGVVLHGGFPCYGSDVATHYWVFERFEVKGGGYTSGNATCAGIWVNVGPFKFRYLYIHDNLSYTYYDNPAGLSSTEMEDSVIEFCWFENNGSDGSTSHNCANICFYGAVGDKADTAAGGYDLSRGGTKNNAVQYCYFAKGSGSGAVGIKHKIDQYFTGRTTNAPWDDTYNTFGDKYHHNVFNDLDESSVYVAQDFAQVYQNIFVTPGSPAICIQYAPLPQFYKVCTYNNTIITPASAAITRWGKGDYFTNELTTHYGYDYNNLIKDGVGSSPWGEHEIINVIPMTTGVLTHDLSHYFGSNNFFFSPNSSDVYRLNGASYTPAEYEAQNLTGSPKIAYISDSGNPFLGTSGIDALRTNGSYTIEGSTTIANGGIGGSHPYLAGVTIPSFIGATNPNDDAWVSGVMNNVSSIAWLRNQIDSDPGWIEGGSGTGGGDDDGPLAPPENLQVN